MNGLSIHVARKAFGGAPVLADVDIEVADGEFVALVGPSGVGKTTLLNMVAGLDRDYAGSICRDGTPLAEPGRSPAGMGVVFQEPRLVPWLTVAGNVRLAEAERMARDRAYASRAEALLDEVGLAGSRDAWPRQLSGGMQRRVALARAFVVEPWLLLMDEPFVSLDTPAANGLRALLRGLCARVRPLVLFVTHDVREALVLADRIVFLGGAPAHVVMEHRVEPAGARDLESPEVAAQSRRLRERQQQLAAGMSALDPGVRACGGAAP